MNGHWSKICRTPKHVVDMYQELRKKLAEHEANCVEAPQAKEDITKINSGILDKAHEEPSKTSDIKFDEDLMAEDEEDLHGDSH